MLECSCHLQTNTAVLKHHRRQTAAAAVTDVAEKIAHQSASE